jgi:hypothetical protein
MIQQLIALAIILFFLIRLVLQKKQGKIKGNEFILWLIFWILAGLAIIFLKEIDLLVASLGFSGTGIEVLLYAGAAVLFYLVFRLRLRLEKIEKDITTIVRNIALNNKKE